MKIRLLLLSIFLIHSVSALVIQGVESDKDSYGNGDLIKLIIYVNEKNLELTADFSKVDSGYNKEMVLFEETADFQYTLWYPITFANNKGSGLHNAVISIYDKDADSSSVISYGIELDNTERLNKSSDSDNIRLKVISKTDDDIIPGSSSSDISVKNGQIMICKPSGCTTLTEQDYEASRKIIIDSGEVELSSLTYNQLKEQITSDVADEVNDKIKGYISQIESIKVKLDTAVYDIVTMNSETQAQWINQTEQVQKTINMGVWLNIAGVLFTILIVGGFLYLVYLKTHTTWLNR